MTHPCPGYAHRAELKRPEVPADMLACRPCWYSLPPPLRVALWRAWNKGAGAGTLEHRAAVTACLRYLEAPP
jgi:hypothetical protein